MKKLVSSLKKELSPQQINESFALLALSGVFIIFG